MSDDVYRIPTYAVLRPFIEQRRSEGGRFAEISGTTLRDEFGFPPGSVDELRRPAFDLMTARGIWTAPARYDLVYADYVLEHVPDPKEAVDCIAHILKPGGWACLTTAFLFPVHEGADHGDFWRFTPSALESLFAGWAEVHTGGWGSRLAAERVLRWQENNHSEENAKELFAIANDPIFPVMVWVYARRP